MTPCSSSRRRTSRKPRRAQVEKAGGPTSSTAGNQACPRAIRAGTRGPGRMSRRMTVRRPLDLAQTLEMGQAFRWRRVGDEEVRHRNCGDPPATGRWGLVLRRAGRVSGAPPPDRRGTGAPGGRHNNPCSRSPSAPIVAVSLDFRDRRIPGGDLPLVGTNFDVHSMVTIAVLHRPGLDGRCTALTNTLSPGDPPISKNRWARWLKVYG